MNANSPVLDRVPGSIRSENRFRALFDHAALGIAIVGSGGRITETNGALLRMFGYQDDGLTGVSFSEITHPEDLPADAAEARRLLKGEQACYSRENRYIRRDGSVFWGRITVSLVPDESHFGVAMIEDIDDRKRTEANLSLFRTVMEASHEAVAILSHTGHIVYANSAYGRLFNMGEAVAAGTHYRSYFPVEGCAVLDSYVGPALMRGESWEGVLPAVDASGRVFPLWQRAGLVRGADGRIKFYFAFMHDHTAQQNFEDELFDAKEQAEAANSAKTRFLAAASHDLRQPMQALSMFVAVLAGRVTQPSEATLVNRIQDSVTALEGLLNGLLDVSKLEAGLVVPHVSDFCVAGMMERLAAEFEPLCEIEGLELKVVPCRAMVQSDPALLERILRNLLNNAVRYTKTGRILFGCRRSRGKIRFQVLDTGIGIPARELKNIFREFHQVGNANRDRRQGLGLGLAIVERLCGLLRHRIAVDSVEGRGSCFTVEAASAVRQAVPHKPRQLHLGLSTRGAHMVVIDDEPDVLDSLRLLLESWGHRLVTGSSADEVIDKLPELAVRPDLIVADYRLANGDTGGEAVARLEAHLEADIPAIILTGDTAPERLQQAKALGHGLLHKPVQADALRAAIDEALARVERAKRRPKARAQVS